MTTTKMIDNPIAYRRQHGIIEGVDRQISDVNGSIGVPIGQGVMPIDLLLKRKSIDDYQHAAGKKFNHDFCIAQFEMLGCVNLNRSGGNFDQTSNLSDRRIDARDRVWKAMKVLGNRGEVFSSISSAIWDVVGKEKTIKDYARDRGFSDNRPLNTQMVKGLVVGGLDILVSHYEL